MPSAGEQNALRSSGNWLNRTAEWLKQHMLSMTAVEFGLISADVLADAHWEYGEETDDGTEQEPGDV